MKHTDSFKDRNKGSDMAEDTMQQYLEDRGLVEFHDWLKIGTDPKESKLPLFWFITNVLLIPDYAVVSKGYIYLIEVKGTLKLKESDYMKIQEIAKRAKKYSKVKVGIYYFAHPNAVPVYYSARKLKELWVSGDLEEGFYEEKDFEGKPKMYRILPV
tara:strand:+ start:969 stop:1439 length:471 start_codon:yes stop_codon:yes gene_type:complete